MSGINIQNLLNQLSSLAGAADSTQSVEYLSDLSNAVLQANNINGVIEYTSKKDLPTPIDSSALGRIYFIPARADYTADGSFDSQGISGGDASGAFYYAKQISDSAGGYSRITTTTDDRTAPPYSFQGSNHGYITGGQTTNVYQNTIQRFSFTSDANATDVGDMAANVFSRPSGQTSTYHGYNSTGNSSLGSTVPIPQRSAEVRRFSFASSANATDVGFLTIGHTLGTGQSSSTHGYHTGGPPSASNIEKFPFSAGNVTAGSVVAGTTTTPNARESVGLSSETNGYITGDYVSPYIDIEKFSFASDGNATDVGNLFSNRNGGAGQSSTTHGYTSGGRTSSFSDIIDKFPFASDGNATNVGDLTDAKNFTSGNSSTTHGYTSGGQDGPSSTSNQENVIEKFPFSSDNNSTDVADLLATLIYASSPGQQN